MKLSLVWQYYLPIHLKISFMYMGALFACMSMHHHVLGAYWGQKRPLDSLELDLAMFMSCCVGAGSQTSPQEEQLALLATEPAFQPALFQFTWQWEYLIFSSLKRTTFYFFSFKLSGIFSEVELTVYSLKGTAILCPRYKLKQGIFNYIHPQFHFSELISTRSVH